MARVKSYIVKTASFAGCHNASKAKCLIMLCNSETARQQDGVLTARQMHLLTGLSYASILSSLKKWCDNFGLMKRFEVQLSDGRQVFGYRATPKSRAWLERHWHEMPLIRYRTEMEAATGVTQGAAADELLEFESEYGAS